MNTWHHLSWAPGCTVLLALSLLAGCGSAVVRSPAAARAYDFNVQGIDRVKAGNLEQALVSFQSALKVEQSIENEDGIALARLNLAGVYQKMQRLPEAIAMLEPVVHDPRGAFTADRRAEASLKRATLLVQSDDTPGAQASLDQAATACAGRCTSTGRILNLRAHLAIASGQFDDGLRWAREARRRNEGDPLETANALRLESSAYLGLKNPDAALPLLHQALALDKALGASEKVYQDLLLLGHASRATPGVARRYWLRAHEVAIAADNPAAVRQSALLLAAEPAQPGFTGETP